MSKDVVVSIKNVSFKYQHENVLKDINLEVIKGDFLGVLGPNGSGKTTLMKIILGLLKPDTGKVELFSQPVSSFKEWSKIGYIPQRASATIAQFPITVSEVVAMGRISHHRWIDFLTKEDRLMIKQSLEAVDMLEYKDRLLNELSGGQLQRIFIARALVSQPELLILDEPTVGVDSESQAKFYELLKKLNKEMKLTLILISHDVDVVANEVSKIACINSTLFCHGDPKDILQHKFMDQLYSKEMGFVAHGH